MKRVLLCKPFHCLGILYVQGRDISKYINQHLDELEQIASEHFMNILDMDKEQKKIKNMLINPVAVNFYPDKRKRQLQSKAFFGNTEKTINDSKNSPPQGALLGLFTPISNSNYREIEVAEGIKKRKMVSFRTNDLYQLIQILKSKTLKDFSVSVYGSDSDERLATGSNGD
jgi:hypothetical protein